PFAVRANAPVRSGASGLALVPALRDSGLAMLVWAAATGLALAFG
ncbi:MAG: 1,4-dihydroxy-2-naphthoate polyprenyltransferase, partial [Rhodococcus sp. (in: high G+C Gram-positive bacteria)]